MEKQIKGWQRRSTVILSAKREESCFISYFRIFVI